jgi:hypothetical protein
MFSYDELVNRQKKKERKEERREKKRKENHGNTPF